MPGDFVKKGTECLLMHGIAIPGRFPAGERALALAHPRASNGFFELERCRSMFDVRFRLFADR
jgi:hypothetical protein